MALPPPEPDEVVPLLLGLIGFDVEGEKNSRAGNAQNALTN